MSYLSLKQLSKLGFNKIGYNVLISKKCSVYGAKNIKIGNNVRIDDFTLLSGGIYLYIGNYVHISSHCGIWGNSGIKINDFCGISSGTKIYSEIDDFSGKTLTGPMIPLKYKTNMKTGEIIINKHSVIGANSVIFPSVVIEEGCIIGANSVVNKNCSKWQIYAGSPIRYIKDRQKELLEQEYELNK